MQSPLTSLHFIHYDDKSAAEFGKIYATLRRRGTPIGVMDMLIAGHAKARELILVTNNIREFERVEGLILETWTDI